MRILSIGAGLGRGGTERALVTFSLAYRRFGHEVAVLAWQEGGQRQAALERDGIDVHRGGRFLRRALEAADAFNPDLIHIHRVGVARDVETAILRRLRTGHRRVLETNVFGRVDRSVASASIDVHMHLSDWCLWRWRRWLGRRQDMPIGVVVPNPVDPEAFVPAGAESRERLRSRLGLPRDAFLCGRIGQPCGGKWHAATFTAFRALATVDPTAHLLLMGLPSSLRRDLDALPAVVRRRIIELPLVDTDSELADTYSLLDAFLHASRIGESFGYVLAEAMLCGCPVVTASTPHVDNSQVEVVGHMTGGIVAASTRGLASALLCLRSNDALRRRLEPGLRPHVVSRFGAEGVARLALRVGELALECGDRAQLRRRIAETTECAERTADGRIGALIRNTLGDPDPVELLSMRVRHQSQVQRLFDAHLGRILARSVREVVEDLRPQRTTNLVKRYLAHAFAGSARRQADR
jgi:glycosyltransferase involved in cell wall biosynthesis